jgi:hypothetical protein
MNTNRRWRRSPIVPIFDRLPSQIERGLFARCVLATLADVLGVGTPRCSAQSLR